MDNPSSPLDTLRQLKEMLDAGALTPTEFEALKQRLVFSPGTAPATSTPLPEPTPPVVLPPAPVAAQPSPTFEDVTADAPAPTPLFNSPRSAYSDAVEPDSPADTYEPEPPLAPEPVYTGHEFPASEEVPARNPLALILSIGGVLVFLAVVAYLSFNRPPSERITSTSLTAADSLAAPIETGPQAEPLAQTVAAPETIRVAPTNPAPPVPPQAAAVRDSAATIPTTSADSAAGQ